MIWSSSGVNFFFQGGPPVSEASSPVAGAAGIGRGMTNAGTTNPYIEITTFVMLNRFEFFTNF
jgi:hypothetical protein